MGQDDQAIESVYDFVYVDRPRVAAFYAQLVGGDDGTLTGITRSLESSDKTGFEGKAGIKVGTRELAEFRGSLGGSVSGATSEAAKREYDPRWLLPLVVMERLDELKLLSRDVASAGLGSFILVGGDLEILDIRMLRDLWDPLVQFLQVQFKNVPLTGATKAARQQQENERKGIMRTLSSQLAIFAELIKKLPHAVQATFATEKGDVWCTLALEHLVIGTDDLALKHGSRVTGRWYVLGILDAQPDTAAVAAREPEAADDQFRNMARTLLGLGRQFLGRPSSSFGVTPVLILREVKGGV